jgi:hypothetical protein
MPRSHLSLDGGTHVLGRFCLADVEGRHPDEVECGMAWALELDSDGIGICERMAPDHVAFRGLLDLRSRS